MHYFLFYWTLIALWVTGFVSAIRDGSVLLTLADIFIPPIGVVHGVIVVLGAL